MAKSTITHPPIQYFNYKISNESRRERERESTSNVPLTERSMNRKQSCRDVCRAPLSTCDIDYSLGLCVFNISRLHDILSMRSLTSRYFAQESLLSVNTLGNTLCVVTKSCLTIRSVIARCLYRCLGLRREQLLTRDKRPIRRWHTNGKESKKGDIRLRLH